MNKKGFTLIEIMAVIIMIGLLLLIGVPTVTRNILSSRKSVYKQHEKAVNILHVDTNHVGITKYCLNR